MRTQHEIGLETASGKKLKDVMFRTSRGLSDTFSSEFGVQFIPTPDDKIVFLADSEKDAQRVRDALNRLAGSLDHDGYISKDYIKKIARPPANDLSGEFRQAANQNERKPASNSKGYEFKPKNETQQKLSDIIDNSDLTFALGPAGTGKTHVAIVKAVQALKAGKIKKILLARPAMEAGEKIGFLPGGQNEKLAPYMRPLYDELEKAFGSAYKKMLDNEIEVVPVGFMRGRTFENAFIILDEAQNTTIEQMKMALTRIGEGSKMVVTGDPDQIDLPHKQDSGLVYAIKRLNGIESVGMMTFSHAEIVRSRIVSLITNALTEEEPKNTASPSLKGP